MRWMKRENWSYQTLLYEHATFRFNNNNNNNNSAYNNYSFQ